MALASMPIDSASPTWRMSPAAARRANSSRVRPAPIFFWKGSRRRAASCTRRTVIASTRSQGAVRKSGSASIAKPGLTPVPRSAFPARRAASSSRRASSGRSRHGKASSSVVVTTAAPPARQLSSVGATWASDELVETTAASGARSASARPRSALTAAPAWRAPGGCRGPGPASPDRGPRRPPARSRGARRAGAPPPRRSGRAPPAARESSDHLPLPHPLSLLEEGEGRHRPSVFHFGCDARTARAFAVWSAAPTASALSSTSKRSLCSGCTMPAGLVAHAQRVERARRARQVLAEVLRPHAGPRAR